MYAATVRRLLPVAVLYSRRIGMVALGLVILLWLSRAMPAEQFGMATTVLALQGLAVVLDLGPVIAQRDYRVMAMISAALAILVLATTARLACHGTIADVCIAYAAYHTMAALALWWRAAWVKPWFGNPFAIGPRVANGVTTPTTRQHAPQP
jgi:O-antigen/teichoic acid export membrane protein